MASIFPNIPGTGSKIPVTRYAAGITELFPNINRTRIIETSVNSRETIDFMPSNCSLNQTVNDKYIEFRINGSSGSFFDLSTLTLEMKLSFNSKGDKVKDEVNMAVINGISQTLFKSVNVFLNGRLVESSPMYNYISYIKLLKEFKKQDLDSLGVCAYLNDDYSEGVTEIYEASTFTTDGKIEKKSMSSLKTKGIETCFPILLDLATLDMFLLDETDIQIRLEIANDSFIIHSDNTAEAKNIRLSIDNVKLLVDRVTPQFSAMTALNESLTVKHIEYLFEKRLTKTYIIGANESSLMIEQPFGNMIPENLSVCFIDNRNFSGDYARNPLYFPHCNIQNITISINGKPVYDITSDFENSYGIRNYYESINHSSIQKGGLITYNGFKNGRAIFNFNFVNEDLKDAVPVELSANMRITITFKERLDNPHVVLLLAETVGILSIDKDRNIHCDVRA